METRDLKVLLQQNFQELSKDAETLFEVSLNKDALWDLYLDRFPQGSNEIFRMRRKFDCSACRQFVRNIGNVVFIKNNVLKTIWDIQTHDATFQPVVDAMANFVRSHAVTDVYVSKILKIGTDKNHENINGVVTEWQHLYLELPSKYQNKTNNSDDTVKSVYRDTRNVFKRSLDEFSEESVLTVLELIAQNSLYKGEEWKGTLNEFLKFKKAYDRLLTEDEKANYAWAESVKAGGAVGRIRNHSMGTLLIDINKDVDLDTAVRKYEAVVAPANYKRPKAIYSKKMLEDAKKKIIELGYERSLGRVHATLDDININNILFSNRDSAKRIQGAADIFEQMSNDIAVNPKNFSRVEEVQVADFVTNILPYAKELELFLENRLIPNFASIIGPADKTAPSMFKWNNAYNVAYTGNVADSMKEKVKAAGGKVDGVLRFSIQWNDTEYDGNDLDAHCNEPGGNHIYYRNKKNPSTTGQLDVDIINPKRGEAAVENITWSDRNRMREGVYQFSVNPFSNRGGRSGFRAEIEFDGQIFSFDYNQELKHQVVVAEVTFSKANGFSIKEMLPSSVSSREFWNLKTNQFVPVSVVCYSPNYWDEQQGNGHRHYMFMLKDCINPEQPNGFYNEFLREELMEHKRVFEALGAKLAVKEVDDQLSGLGFSSTKRNDVLVKVKGQTERVIKIKF